MTINSHYCDKWLWEKGHIPHTVVQLEEPQVHDATSLWSTDNPTQRCQPNPVSKYYYKWPVYWGQIQARYTVSIRIRRNLLYTLVVPGAQSEISVQVMNRCTNATQCSHSNTISHTEATSCANEVIFSWGVTVYGLFLELNWKLVWVMTDAATHPQRMWQRS